MAELDDVTLDGRPLDSLRVTDLRTALEERGLPKSGQKNALLKRLKGALMLEDLQKHSSPHTGFQPNSQMGEEMGQNSFIKQYLEKQQELLRQRLQKEAREAAETEEQMVESEDEGLQSDIIPEHPESLHTVLKVPEVEQGKRTPKKCRLVLEEPEEFDEERPRKRERRSSRVKQAKIPKSPVLEKAVLESEQRRPSTRGRRSKGDAVLAKEEPEEEGEEEKETEEKEIKTTKDEDDLPKRRRLSTRAVTPLQHKRSPGVKQSPTPPELLEISSRSTSLETTDERVPPLLPIEEMKQQLPAEKQDKAMSEKSGPPMPTEDAKVLRSPHKWRRQAREKAERGSELISHLHQEISVIQPTSNWRQESDKPKTKKHTSPLGEEKVSSPIGTKIGSTPKDVKGSPALVLIRPAVFGKLEGKRAAGSQSLHIVEKSAGRGVQAMSILEKQEPSPHSVVHEDNKSWSVPGQMSEIKSLTDLNKPGFEKSDMKPSLDVINFPESDNLHESSLVGSACTNKVKRLKSRTSVGASNQYESVTVKSRHISKRHNPCETEIPEVVKESPEVNQKKQLRSRSKKQKPNEKFSEPSKKKEKELTHANEVQNISGLERPVTKSVQSSEELMEVTQLDNLSAPVSEQSKDKTVETQIENLEDSQFSDHCAPDPEITLEKVEQRHLCDHFTPAPDKTPEKVEERPLDDHRTPFPEIIKEKEEEIYLDDHCIHDPQMLSKKVKQTHLSDPCRPAPKISKEMVEKSYVNFHCVPDPEKNVGNVEKAEDRFASFPETLHEKFEETELDDICADNVEESEKNREETQIFDSCGTHVEESEVNRVKTKLVDFCAPDVVKESEEKSKGAQLIDICVPDVEELEKFREEAQLMDIKAPNVGEVERNPQEAQCIETCAPDVEDSEENREATQLTNICAPDVEESEENREATQLTNICAPDVEESEENREATQLTNICAPDVEESEENREATQLTNICAPDVEESEERGKGTLLGGICAIDVEESEEKREEAQFTFSSAPESEKREENVDKEQLVNSCIPDLETSEEKVEERELSNQCKPDLEATEKRAEEVELYESVIISEGSEEKIKFVDSCELNQEQSDLKAEVIQVNDNIDFVKEIATVHSEVTQPDGDYALIEESKEVASFSVMPANIVNDVILSVNQTSSVAEDETSMQLQKSPDSLSQEKDTLVIQETPDLEEMSSEQAKNDHDSSNLVISASTVVSDGAPKANVYDMPVDKTVIPYDTCADVVMTEEMDTTSVTPEQSLTAISGSQEAILSKTADDGKCVEKEKHVEATEILQKSLSSMTPIITKEHDAQLTNILNTVNTNETTDVINQVFPSANRDSDFVSNVPEQLHLEDKVLSGEVTHKTCVILHDIAGLVTLEENNPAVVQETSKLIELVHDKPNESETAEHTFRIPESKFKMCADESPMGIQETTETVMPKDMVSLTTKYQGEETSEIENAMDKSITNIQKPSDIQGESVELEISLEGSKLGVQKTHEVQKRNEPEASNKTPDGMLEVELPAAEPVVSTVPDSKVMKPLGLSISPLQEEIVKEHFACPVFSTDGEVVTADSLIAIEEQQTLSTEAIEKSTEGTPSGNPVDIPIKTSLASMLENVRGTNESNERKASETNGSFLSVAQTEEKIGTQHHDTTTEGSLVYPVTSEPLIIEDKKAAELMELQKSANEGNPEGLVRKLQRTRTSSSSSSSSTTSSSSSSSSSSNSSRSSSERSSHSRHSSRSRSSSVARHSRSSRSSSSSSSSRSSSSHSDKVDGSSVSTSLKNSPEPLSAEVQFPPLQDTLQPLPSTSPPLPSKPVSLQQNRTPPKDSSFHQDHGECTQTQTTLVNLTNQEHSKTMKIEPESQDQDQKKSASMEQKIGEETSPGDSNVAPEREDVVMEATDSQTESEPQEAAPAQPLEERLEGDDNKESTTPLRTFKRKISVISAKCSSQTSAPSATNSDGEGAHPARRRRWGASTATTQKKPSISISTESLKSLIPEIKEIKQEAIVDLHADDTHISEDESERNGDENSHDKGLKICRTVTQVVPAEVQENGQDGEEEAAEAAVPEPDPIPMETDVVAAQPPIEQQEDKKPLADSPARAEVRVTLGDTLLRRSISQQKTGVSVTIDDPVRTASQLPSPPRRKISCIVHICNLVRPFTLGQLKELLSRTGTLIEEHFWIDKIKSHCYVTYPTVEEAVATRNSLHGVKWPQSNPKFLSVDFAEQDELDFHRGLLTERPPEPKQEEPPHPHMPAPRGEHRDHDRGVREQWAEREREMERRERTRSEREWDRDKIREDPRSRSRDRRRKEHAKSKEKKNEKKEKVQEEPPAKLLDDLFHKTKAAPCIYWLPLTEDQVLKKVADRAERAKEREKRRKEQEEQEEEERKERAKEREKEMDRSRERAREAEKRREHSREHPRERDRREQKRHSRSRSRSTPVRDRGGRR